MVFCDKIPSVLPPLIEKVYAGLKEDKYSYSFYPMYIQKQVTKKLEINNYFMSKEIIKAAVKQLIDKKIENNELEPRYIIQCFSCYKKITSPVSDLSQVPKKLHCDHCNIDIDFEQDYSIVDVRYVFVGKEPPTAVKNGLL